MGRLSRILIATGISLGIHVLFLAVFLLQMDRRPVPEKPTPPISVGLLRRNMDNPPAGDPPEQPIPDSQTGSPDPRTSPQASPPPPVDTTDAMDSEAGGYPSVPEWRIDTPPRMIRPGDAPARADVHGLLDAMPLTASVYLNALGRPYLILYDPWPGESARTWLNDYFLTAGFTPGLVGETPVSSRLDIPMRLRGMEGR